MKPLLYRAALHYIEQRDDLPNSSLRPVQMAELLAIEEHMGSPLPSQYAEWLLTVGAGKEHGGLALWHHCDITRRGSVAEASKHSGPSHRDMLVFFDSMAGELFGFLKGPKGWSKEVYAIEDNGSFEQCSTDFSSFLRQNLDCSEEELQRLQEDQMVAV